MPISAISSAEYILSALRLDPYFAQYIIYRPVNLRLSRLDIRYNEVRRDSLPYP